MAATSIQPPVSYNAKPLCRIVGIVCLSGFFLDMLVRLLPPNLGNVDWRLGIMQQLSDRAIILLFGTALMLYSTLELRALRKKLALASLIVGIMFILSCVLVIQDSFAAHNIAVRNINTQAEQVQSQIQTAKENPGASGKITPEQLEQAAELLNQRVGSFKENAKTGLMRTAIGIIGNLIVMGVGLIGLGRYGMRPSKG
jgi:predicted PurR-regulated permease PerM